MCYKNNTTCFYYVDDGIFMGPDSGAINKSIEDIERAGLDIEDKGNIEDYLGLNVEEQDNGNINLTQPKIIDSIINDVQIVNNTAPQQTLTLSTKIIHHNAASPPFDEHFIYQAVVGKLKFLEKITRPDIAYAKHQCTRFSQYPRAYHGDAIIQLLKYLKATRLQGIMLDPEGSKSFEVYADADFFGNWHHPTASDDTITVKSRTGYDILYAGCSIVWRSKLQSHIALSTMEAEYIALLQSLRNAIPMMQLLR